MAAPQLTFSITGNKISAVSGSTRSPFPSRRTSPTRPSSAARRSPARIGAAGKGALIASFSQTPAGTQRTFEVYDDFLLSGDGEYRISLFAQGADGSWNDNYGFIPLGESQALKTADGEDFLCMKE